VLSDAITSVGVIVAALVMVTTGWYYADPLVSAGIGLFIVPRTGRLIGDAVGVLLEGTPSDVNLAELRRGLAALDGVREVHDLHVWTLTSGVHALSVHLIADPQSSVASLLDRARHCAVDHFRIAHVTIQIEPPGWHCEGPHL
jgi:cobalt-zinc-cadmium efflux system protein